MSSMTTFVLSTLTLNESVFFCFLHVDLFCQNVLLISGAFTVAMTACARMEQNVIHETVLVPAPLGGKGSFVRSHVTKVTMVTNVKKSVDA